jgi:uncharacterized protein (DUF4415 family)
MVACTFRRSGDAEANPDRQRAAGAAASVRLRRRQINSSDIPDSSVDHLNAMRCVGRPPLGDEPRRLIAIRVDAEVLDRFRKEARRPRVEYQALINEVRLGTSACRVGATCRQAPTCPTVGCALTAIAGLGPIDDQIGAADAAGHVGRD